MPSALSNFFAFSTPETRLCLVLPRDLPTYSVLVNVFQVNVGPLLPCQFLPRLFPEENL